MSVFGFCQEPSIPSGVRLVFASCAMRTQLKLIRDFSAMVHVLDYLNALYLVSSKHLI